MKVAGEARVGQLFGPRHGPVAIGEVVLLDRRMLLNLAVAAVMVGKQQALVGDDFAGAATAKLHHRIFQAAFVDAVNVFSRDL